MEGIFNGDVIDALNFLNKLWWSDRKKYDYLQPSKIAKMCGTDVRTIASYRTMGDILPRALLLRAGKKILALQEDVIREQNKPKTKDYGNGRIGRILKDAGSRVPEKLEFDTSKLFRDKLENGTAVKTR